MPQSSKQNKSKRKKWKYHSKSKTKTQNKNKSKRNKRKKHHNTKRAHKTDDQISKETMTDPRFKKVFTDPRYQSIPQTQKDPSKIQVDSRFSSMFTDPAFRTSYRIDRYGREITNNEAYDLHKFYALDQNGNSTQNEGYEAEHEHSASDEGNPLSKNLKKTVDKFKADQQTEITAEDSFWDQWDDHGNGNKDIAPLTSKEQKLLNRKAGRMFAYAADSSSSSSSESEYEYSKLTVKEVGEDARAILDGKERDNSDGSAEVKPTNRLAIVNCDWDNISSKDIYMIFRSFLPSEGSIVKVSIYPSEYGIKMMRTENEMGPSAAIWEKNALPAEVKNMEEMAEFIDANAETKMEPRNEESVSEESMDENTQKLHAEMLELEKLESTIQAIKEGRAGDVLEKEIDTVYNKQALRKYELQKLRYYYGICEFDTVETADKLYQELNNREYRHTCNVLNLSFVEDAFVPPNEPTSVCTDIPDNYTAASDKHTNALGSTFLELSWDQTDPNRVEICQKSFTVQQLNKMDLDAYLQESEGLTDAGFDTDYPVTEYDTDTPDKKVLIKRRARNRYKEILGEFRAMEKTVHGSDSEQGYTSGATTDDEENLFRINIGKGTNKVSNVLQERLKQKTAMEMEKIRNTKLNLVQDLSSTSSEESVGDKVGDAEDSFYIDDEVSKLNEWIDTQKRLKVSIDKSINDNELEVPRFKKRKREELGSDGEFEENDEPLVMEGDIGEDEMNDPYFESEMVGMEPPKKKQRLEGRVSVSEEDKKRRAMLEMMMASNDNTIGSYDPENNEMSKEEIFQARSLNKKLRRNWRLQWLIKKKVKEKLRENDKFEFNEKDARFGAIMDNPDFAIDPTNAAFKGSKVMNRLLQNTRKQRLNRWNKKSVLRKNKKEKVSTIDNVDHNKIIESLKIKNSKIVKLKDGQKMRKGITDKLKEKGLW